MNKKRLVRLGVFAAIIVVVVVIFSSATFVTIQPGERGVIFRPLTSGLDKDNIYDEGLHIIAPWNTLKVYDVREQKVAFSKEESNYGILDVLDKNGLTIEVEVTIRFYPNYGKIGYIHQQFGKSYITKLVIPEVRAAVRKTLGKYTAEEIYSTKRQELEEQIIKETGEVLHNNNIEMTALLIRSIIIPENLKKAIETKQTKQQEALAYDYVVQKELKEKERIIIKAEGIAEYNRIINASMTDKVLTYEGIQATIKLANSANSKTVIVGNSKNGLPLILNQ